LGKAREHWGSKIGFLMAAAGSAIGLGSLWRFPYIVSQNGGGMFIFLYVVFVFALVLPIFMSELILGRKTQKSPILAYSALSRRSQNWRVAGWLNVINAFLILSFYAVVAGWTLNYILMSLCQFTAGKTDAQISGLFDILHKAPGLNVLWQLLFLLLTGGVILGGVRKGIEYWSKVLMPALFVFLLGLVIYGMTLPGFSEACSFLFSIDTYTLKPSSILEALGMAFFTMSVGIGIIVTYGSYMKPDENISQTSTLVAFMTVVVSLLAVLMIYPVVFTFGLETAEGPGLVFKTLPVLFNKLPGSLFVSTLFFTLLAFTALTSAISLLEELVASVMDLFAWTRKKATAILTGAAFLMGIPSALAGSGVFLGDWEKVYGKNFFSTLDMLTGTWLMPIGGLLVSLFVGFWVDKEISKKELLTGSKKKIIRAFFPVWLFMVRFVAPIAILLIMLQKAEIINIDAWLSK
jgi:neurotransmitter:Na+ symporter, NSS family